MWVCPPFVCFFLAKRQANNGMFWLKIRGRTLFQIIYLHSPQFVCIHQPERVSFGVQIHSCYDWGQFTVQSTRQAASLWGDTDMLLAQWWLSVFSENESGYLRKIFSKLYVSQMWNIDELFYNSSPSSSTFQSWGPDNMPNKGPEQRLEERPRMRSNNIGRV